MGADMSKSREYRERADYAQALCEARILFLSPWPRVNMLPVERNARLIGPTTTTPPQPVLERDRAPGGFEEA